LKRRGITNVRPLAGGLEAWRARGYPVEFRGPHIEPHRRALNAA
jgi:rhodanese-related sulfurtransferase